MGKDQLIGNTGLTAAEFQEIIKGKTDQQLKMKISLGGTIIKSMDPNIPEERETRATVQKQVKLLRKELQARQAGLKSGLPELDEPAEAGPKDQVIGMQTVRLSGKASIGS